MLNELRSTDIIGVSAAAECGPNTLMAHAVMAYIGMPYRVKADIIGVSVAAECGPNIVVAYVVTAVTSLNPRPRSKVWV